MGGREGWGGGGGKRAPFQRDLNFDCSMNSDYSMNHISLFVSYLSLHW